MESTKKKSKKRKSQIQMSNIDEHDEAQVQDVASPNASAGASIVSIANEQTKRAPPQGSGNIGENSAQLRPTDANKVEEEVATKKRKKRKAASAELDSSAKLQKSKEMDESSKRTNGIANTPAPRAVVSQVAPPAAHAQAACDKANAAEMKKKQNRELREQFKSDPSSLTNEEKIRAKALIRVFEATEAARAAKSAALSKGDTWQGSNERKRSRQAEIAAERKRKKLQNKPPTAPEPRSTQQGGRGGIGRGRGVPEGRGHAASGRGVSGRGVSASTHAVNTMQQRGRGRGVGGRGYPNV